MGFCSTILGFCGFGMGISIGLVIGYYLFIYLQPTDVKDLSIMRLRDIPLTQGRGTQGMHNGWMKDMRNVIYSGIESQDVIITTVTMTVVGLDRHTVFILIALCDLGLNSEALVALFKELRKEPPTTTTIVSCF